MEQQGKEITIVASEDFGITFYESRSLESITIKVTYKNKSQDSAFTIDLLDTTFVLKNPINILVLRDKLNSVINSKTSENRSISQSSLHEIFVWLDKIPNTGGSVPLAGMLIPNTHIYVARNGGEKTYDERTKKVFNAMALLNKAVNQEELEYKKAAVLLDKVPDSFLTGGATVAPSDTTTAIGTKKSDLSPARKKKLLTILNQKANNDKADSSLYGLSTETIRGTTNRFIESAKKLDETYLTIKEQYIFPIKKISIQIERGFIERIQVWVEDQLNRERIYENVYAIGFSSIKNFRFFDKTRLFPRFENDTYIYLSDVFDNYNNRLDNYTRDYSPADTTINEYEPKNGPISLHRDEFVNLFDTKVYTDLSGLKPNSPNGLIQIEVARRFNIKTSRIQVGKLRSDFGFLSYYNVYGSYNKLESEQRNLPLRNENVAENGELLSPSYATNLDFRQYENFSIGSELNAILFDWPDGKLTTFLDFGARYGHTPVVDHLRTVAGNKVNIERDTIVLSGHSATWYPKIGIELFSEKRVGFVFSYQLNSTYLFSNNNFKQIKSYAKSDLVSRTVERSARQSHMLEVYLRAEPTGNRNGRFFFRGRYFIQHRDTNTFFSQFQLGYSYNLLFRK